MLIKGFGNQDEEADKQAANPEVYKNIHLGDAAFRKVELSPMIFFDGTHYWKYKTVQYIKGGAE